MTYTPKQLQYFAFLYWQIFGNIYVMDYEGATPGGIQFRLK